MTPAVKDLNYYLALEYPYTVVPDDGSFFVRYPDLPGCMTQVDDAADIPAMAQEIKELWLETALEDLQTIPEPITVEYSGKFVVRLPKSLHQSLAYQAGQEGMSLNGYVVQLLGERSSTNAMLKHVSDQIAEMREEMMAVTSASTYSVEITSPQDELSARRSNKLKIEYGAVAV